MVVRRWGWVGFTVRRERKSRGVTDWRAHMEEELVKRIRKGDEGVGHGGMRVSKGVTMAHCGSEKVAPATTESYRFLVIEL